MTKFLLIIASAAGIGIGLASFPSDVNAHPSNHEDLLLYNADPGITDCGQCGHYRSGTGPLYDCNTCSQSCDCLVETITIGATTYDGTFYPGVNPT